MVAALIPVKSLATAKSRLAGILDPLQRCALVITMLEKVVIECLACDKISSVFIVTPDQEIAAIAEKCGATAIAEPARSDLNGAVASGLTKIRSFGASQILILPADIPFLTQTELRELLSQSRSRYQSVLVPCHKSQGTNALLIPSQAAFTPQFGKASFRHHLAQLAALGLSPHILELPGIAADIDEPEDLKLLAHFSMPVWLADALPDRRPQCRQD